MCAAKRHEARRALTSRQFLFMRTLHMSARNIYFQNPILLQRQRRKVRLRRSKNRHPKRNEKLFDELLHEKDCLPSVAFGCILLLESRARMKRCFSLASCCKTEAKCGG